MLNFVYREKGDLALNINEQVLKDMEDACPICMDTYETDPKTIFVGLVKQCGHYFHFECLWNWLELNQTCPICRVTCNLAESDLHGLSLKQVLELVKSNELSNTKKPAAPITAARIDVSAPLQSGVHPLRVRYISAADSSSESGDDVIRPTITVATVITTQPHSTVAAPAAVDSDVTTAVSRRSCLVERMKRHFEGAGDASSDDCDTETRDNDGARTGVSAPSMEQGSSAGHSDPVAN